jgi:hypothetical protein
LTARPSITTPLEAGRKVRLVRALPRYGAEGTYPDGWQDNQYLNSDAVRMMTVYQTKGIQWGRSCVCPRYSRTAFPSKSLHAALAEVRTREVRGDIADASKVRRPVDTHLHVPYAYRAFGRQLEAAAEGVLRDYLQDNGDYRGICTAGGAVGAGR